MKLSTLLSARRRPVALAAVALGVVTTLGLAPAAGAVAPHAASTAKAGTCTVTNGKITWGFKESFRSYISGSIAHGEWTTTGNASYKTPEFTWNKGTGTYDPKTGKGNANFTGTVKFTGHDGLLDTQIANPRIVWAKKGPSYLVFDVSNVSMASAVAGKPETVTTKGVRFVQFDASKAKVSGRTITLTDAATALTPAGSKSFGESYKAGDAFDPVDVTLTLNRTCKA